MKWLWVGLNVLGIIVFLFLAWLLSADRKKIRWISVGLMVLINILLAAFLTYSSLGRNVVEVAAAGFSELVDVAQRGISFVLGWWAAPVGTGPTPADGGKWIFDHVQIANNVLTVTPHHPGGFTFVVIALLPILLVVPMFDILTYIGVLPWIIKWIGRGLSFITRQPKFESFFAVEMMFLGNTEALAVSKVQLTKMKAKRNVTLAFMSMSCITASILAAYIQMVPGQFVMTAVPINCINALLVAHLLYPVEVTPEEDVIYSLSDSGETVKENEERLEEDAAAAKLLEEDAKDGNPEPAEEIVAKKDARDQTQITYDALPWYKKILKHNPGKPKKEPFFSFLGDSILGSGRLILIIMANVIAFVALASLINVLLGLIPFPHGFKLTIQAIFGAFLWIPSMLLGFDPSTAWYVAQNMGLKLVTNEFVVMGEVGPQFMKWYNAGQNMHLVGCLTVFLTSFANFSTLGMVLGCFKSLVDKDKNKLISKEALRMFVSGILVSLLSAAMVGLFVW